MVSRLLIQLRLNGIEQGSINDRGLFAPEDFALEGDLSDVEPIAKQVGERPPGKWDAPYSLPCLQAEPAGQDL